MRPPAQPTNDGGQPKLLYLCNNASYFDAHWRNRAVAASRAGFDVAVAVPNPPREQEQVPWRWVAYDVDRRRLDPITNLRGLIATVRLLAAEEPDLVVSITIKPNLFSALSSRLVRQRPLIMNVTGLGSLFSDRSLRHRVGRTVVMRLFRWSAAPTGTWGVFENSEDRERFVRAGVVSSDRAVLLGGAGVDISHFAPTPEIAYDPPVVILPARMLWDKGVAEFVAAARMLRQEGVPVRMVLVGDSDAGNPGAIPRSQLQEWHEQGDVEWWGHRDDMPDVIGQSNVVCLPSRYGEGIPRILIEAGACARAIVTTDNVGCREFVTDGENGLLVPPGDVPLLAGAIRRLTQDPALRNRFGHSSRSLVERDYSDALVTTRTVSLYRQVSAADHTRPTLAAALPARPAGER